MQKLKFLFSIILVFLVFGVSVVGADFNLGDWRYEKQINLLPLSQTEFVELSFDNDVFANTAPGLRDIRVIDNNSKEVPYKLLVERGGVERSSFSVSIFNKTFVPGQHTSFIVDLRKEGSLHNQIEIKTSSINFRRQVMVEGGKDATNWAVLQANAIIYDYTDLEAGLKTKNTVVI